MSALPCLSPTARRVLALLIAANGKPVQHSTIGRHLWGEPHRWPAGAAIVIQVQIRRLRKEVARRDWRIETLRGIPRRYRLARREAAAEVLEAREMVGLAYDVAKRAARMQRAKSAVTAAE